MPTISPTDLQLLRNGDHRTEVFASALSPRVLWSARVNDGSIGIGERTIFFDGGSGLNWNWVQDHQTVHIGTTPGGHDIGIGRVRIKSVSSGDGGITGTVTVGANSIPWQDNAYLTFLHTYELWSIFPRIDGSEVFYKDYDITYNDQNEEMTPVAIAGPHRARFSEPGVGYTYQFPIGNSYAIAPGAGITTLTITITPFPAGIITGPYSFPNMPIFIPDGDAYYGQYWVRVQVADNNGKTQQTFRSIFHHSSDPTHPTYPITEIESLSISGDWNTGGWESGIVLKDKASISEIPEGTLFLIWSRSYYQGVEQDVSTRSWGRNILLSGYARNDQYERVGESGGSASFSVRTIDDLLRNRGLFSVSLESKDNPDKWYKFLNNYLTAGRIVHHFYKWHSTLLEVTDVFGLKNDGGIQRKAADIERGTLYNMPDNLIRNQGIFAHLVCSKAGEMRMARDLLYRDDATRAAAPIVADFEDGDILDGGITVVHRPFFDTSFVFVSGIAYDGSTATPIGSTAPSEWPSAFGSKVFHVERQMMVDQASSNELAGQILAIQNNEFPEVRVSFSGNYAGVLEVADQEWWRMTLNPSDTIRQIPFTDKKMICRNVSLGFDLASGIVIVRAVFIPDADGTPGVPYQWPDTIPSGGGEPPPIPTGDAAALLSAASLYYQPYGDVTWQLRTVDPLNDITLDPYWAVKAAEIVASNAIVMTSEAGVIRRSIDSGVSFSTLAPGNPPNDYGDAPAPSLATVDLIQCISTNLIDNFVWIVRWQNGSGIWRSWYLKTEDDGSSFTWSSM